MPFTLTRYKDGKPVAVKVSIWDAFKGVPNPKPRKPKPCTCCNKVHSKSTSSDHPTTKENEKVNSDKITNKGGNKKQDGTAGSAKEKSGGEHSHSTREEETFSAEDDKMMVEMKAAKKTWAEIVEALGKTSKSQVQAHWKLINPETSSGNEIKKANDKNEDKKKVDEDKESKIARMKAEGQAKKAKAQADAEATKKQKDNDVSTDSAVDGAAANVAEATIDMKTFASRYDKQKWMAAASKHFDLTGQRITPIMARKIAEGIKPV